MRPLSSSNGPAESRVGSSFFFPAPDTPQMSYFLVDENEIGAYSEQDSFPSPRRLQERGKHGPGVVFDPEPDLVDGKSCAGTPVNRVDTGGTTLPKPREESEPSEPHDETSAGILDPSPGPVSYPPPLDGDNSPLVSGSLFELSIPGSESGSSASRKGSLSPSFSEYPASQLRSVPDEGSLSQSQFQSTHEATPQLIMPLICMPSRRPFTERGKMIGGLKILVAGATGAGKTSLITAILQCCEHIVHVDDISAPERSQHKLEGFLPALDWHRRYPRLHAAGIAEVFASTMPRPSWWSLSRDFQGQVGGHSDAILDRNICFVDTPGYQDCSDLARTAAAVQEYLDFYLRPYVSSPIADSDMLKMLSESGGGLVSTVLYLIAPTGITQQDIQYLQSIQQMATVIPVVSYADTLSVEEVAAVKENVSRELAKADIKPLTFGVPATADTSLAVYAISSAPGSDYDLADESLLVSSEYMQPLVTTDLARLVDDIFCPNGASWLRHAAAKTCLTWRRKNLRSGLLETGSCHDQDQRLVPRLPREVQGIAWRDGINSIMCEDTLGGWAAALRRSLSHEGWVGRGAPLCELAVGPGPPRSAASTRQKMPTNTSRSSSRSAISLAKRLGIGKATKRRAMKCPTRQDPLGLLQLLGGIRCEGQIALELLGTVGVLGTFGVWVWRSGA